MKREDFLELFRETHEYNEYDNILPERRLSLRPDLNAFLLLEKLVPPDLVNGFDYAYDLVSASDYDEIFLSIDTFVLSNVCTEEDVLDLRRCGVRYDAGNNCLCMYV